MEQLNTDAFSAMSELIELVIVTAPGAARRGPYGCAWVGGVARRRHTFAP